MRASIEVKHRDGTVTVTPLRLGVSKHRKLLHNTFTFRNVVIVPGNNIGIQEDEHIVDKVRFFWNEGIQIAFKYYE